MYLDYEIEFEDYFNVKVEDYFHPVIKKPVLQILFNSDLILSLNLSREYLFKTVLKKIKFFLRMIKKKKPKYRKIVENPIIFFGFSSLLSKVHNEIMKRSKANHPFNFF